MRIAVHYHHAACLALECGYSAPDALALAMFDQLTDVATPKFCRQKNGRFPDEAFVVPLVTQVDEVYGFWSLVGDDFNPAWLSSTHRWHFGAGPGVYGPVEFTTALQRLPLCHGHLPSLGRYLHLAQDYASHHGFAGFPTQKNRHLGDSRNCLSKCWKKAWSSDNLLGHVTRPEVDDLAVSRERIICVSVDIRKALWQRAEQPTETSDAIGLLLTATDDKELVKLCKAYWLKHTGKAMPDFCPPSPQSDAWKRWCE